MATPSPLSAERTDRYLRGMCHGLALAVHALTGWEVVGVADRRPGGHDPDALRMDHAMVRTPGGLLLDGGGLRTEDEVVEAFDAPFRDPAPVPSPALLRMGIVPLPPHPGHAVHPTTPGRLAWYVARRTGHDLRYFGPDCRAELEEDARTLVAWAAGELGLDPGELPGLDGPGAAPRF